MTHYHFMKDEKYVLPIPNSYQIWHLRNFEYVNYLHGTKDTIIKDANFSNVDLLNPSYYVYPNAVTGLKSIMLHWTISRKVKSADISAPILNN